MSTAAYALCCACSVWCSVWCARSTFVAGGTMSFAKALPHSMVSCHSTCRQFATAVVPIGGGLSVQWRWLRSGSSASYTTGSGRRIPFGMSAMWSQSSHRWLSRVLLSWLLLLPHVCPICLTSLIPGLGPRAPFMSHPRLEPLTLLASYRMGTAPSQRRLQPVTQAWRVVEGRCSWMGGLMMQIGRRWRRALRRRSLRQSPTGFRSMRMPLCWMT
mmetsp:Transcript_9863/g.22389  ORF Transcript_9863/g.22389 Transcript_9863/m.22389 type:complete len:215 (+) Transcript_9863:274-918(+)